MLWLQWGGTLVFTVTTEELPATEECSDGRTQYTYSHSWQEIYDAMRQGTICVHMYDHSDSINVNGESMDFIKSALHETVYFYIETTTTIYDFADATSKVYVKCRDRQKRRNNKWLTNQLYGIVEM